MKRFVLMGDIVGSSEKPGAALMADFQKIISQANSRFQKVIASPLTITLGDEFQGIIEDLKSAAAIIFFLDEELLRLTSGFRIRYSLYHGDIDTPVNPSRAHEMLGEGLTKARKELEQMKQEKRTYHFYSGQQFTDELLNGLFQLYNSLYSEWSLKDKPYLLKFFERDDYKWVSSQVHRDPSTVWRKRNSLKLDEFNTAKKLIYSVASQFKK